MSSTGLRPRGQMGMTKVVGASDLPALRADYADTSDFTAAFGDGSFRIERFDVGQLDLVSAVWDELVRSRPPRLTAHASVAAPCASATGGVVGDGAGGDA